MEQTGGLRHDGRDSTSCGRRISAVRFSLRDSVRAGGRGQDRPARGAWKLGFPSVPHSGHDVALATSCEALDERRSPAAGREESASLPSKKGDAPVILPLRQRHRLMVCTLGVLLPVAFVAGIAARKPAPVAGTVPAALNDIAKD